MNEVVFLDTTPLWLACLSRNSANPERDLCIAWLDHLRKQSRVIVIPEIADYETRRKLLHQNLKQPGQWVGQIQRLDTLKAINQYLPINTTMMLKAAQLWADSRYAGHSSAGETRLDADVIITAQAIISDNGRNEVIVATKNVKHFIQLVPAANWWEII